MVSQRSLDRAIDMWVRDNNTGNFSFEEAEKVLDALAHEYLSNYLEMSADELKEETGASTVVDALYDLFNNELMVSFTNGNWSNWGKAGYFRVGRSQMSFIINEEEAERIAEEVVRQDLEYEPDIFNEDWVLNYVDEERYMNDVRSDIENWISESPESYASFFSEKDLAEGIINYLEEKTPTEIMEILPFEILENMGYGKGLDMMMDSLLRDNDKEELMDAIEKHVFTLEDLEWTEIGELISEEELNIDLMDKDRLLSEIAYGLSSLDVDELFSVYESMGLDIPDKAISTATENYIDDILSEGLIDWLKGLGYSGRDLYEHLSPYIDIDEASENAVAIDGWEHFLSRYDGRSYIIKNGVVVFRED